LVRLVLILAAAASLSGCMTSTRNAADAFYGSLFPGSNTPADKPAH
jgi:hypothetical protein